MLITVSAPLVPPWNKQVEQLRSHLLFARLYYAVQKQIEKKKGIKKRGVLHNLRKRYLEELILFSL